MQESQLNIVILAGGVGGARFSEGALRAKPDANISVVVNVADDDEFYGLLVCPDLDTVLYTLADLVDRRQGWGVADDTTQALSTLSALGAPSWMKLGDRDFGLHIWRSWRLAQGASLTEVMAEASARYGVRARILPATDDRLRTRLLTSEGLQDFQDWFVRMRCAPTVRRVDYDGATSAVASSAALAAIHDADLILFAPSNPILSIEPILAIDALRTALVERRGRAVAVSPLIGGKAVKGPLDKLLSDLGYAGGAEGVAKRYSGLLDGFIVDRGDESDAVRIEQAGVGVLRTDILMRDAGDAGRLATEVFDFALHALQ